jgi:hypothetical protein
MLEPVMLTKLFLDIVSDGPSAVAKSAVTSAIPGSDALELIQVARDLAGTDSTPSSIDSSAAGPPMNVRASRGLGVSASRSLSVRRR